MKDILIPLGALLFIVLFGYAMVHSARKQKKKKSNIFKEFADNHGLSYNKKDDGKAQQFALGFHGIGQFRSPSRGKVLPTDVIGGRLHDAEVILFHHSTCFYDGWSKEWFVVGMTLGEPVADHCAIQFCRNSSERNSIYLENPVVKEAKFGQFNIIVRASDSADIGRLKEESFLELLSSLVESAPFRPEIQVSQDRILIYLAERNAVIEDLDMLEILVKLTKEVAASLRE